MAQYLDIESITQSKFAKVLASQDKPMAQLAILLEEMLEEDIVKARASVKKYDNMIFDHPVIVDQLKRDLATILANIQRLKEI